ncbi:MAG: methyltransferase domain-containing protein [Thermodesulfobacteriota bacterium]
MNPLKGILNLSSLMFMWRYFRGQTPWDTNITPPEVMEFIQKTSPGRALDLGCGTGTNGITLARHGWKVTGVDFAPIHPTLQTGHISDYILLAIYEMFFYYDRKCRLYDR